MFVLFVTWLGSEGQVFQEVDITDFFLDSSNSSNEVAIISKLHEICGEEKHSKPMIFLSILF